jgi:hypothetical protein
VPFSLLHDCTNEKVHEVPHALASEGAPDQPRRRRRRRRLKTDDAAQPAAKPTAPAKRRNPLAGAPANTAPIEKRWEFLANCQSLLSAWECGFVADMGQPKHWRGDRLFLTTRQQACLAKIYAKLLKRLKERRAYDVTA